MGRQMSWPGCRECLSTFTVLVEVCDVGSLIRAHRLGADEMANCFLLAEDLSEGPVQVPLPVDLVAVHLVGRRTLRTLWSTLPCGQEPSIVVLVFAG